MIHDKAISIAFDILISPPFLFPQNESDGRAFQLKRLSEIVFKISFISKEHQFFFIYKQNKGWRLNASLRCIIDFEAFSALYRRLQSIYGVIEQIIQHAGGDSAAGSRIYFLDFPENRGNTLP